MSDPLAEIVTLLQPSASFSKVVEGAGQWRVSRVEAGRPFYSVILGGSLRLAVYGHEEMTLETGDFVLIPAAYDFTMSSLEPVTVKDAGTYPIELTPGQFRIGCQDGPPDVRALIGYCVFGSSDASLLVSLLPQLIHVRGESRLATLVQLVDEESRQRRPGRDVILAHLLEVILIEALRSTKGPGTSPGLVRGLGDERLATALRLMHERPTHPWTVAELARKTALSRSTFFERFRRAVGVAPMEYLLHWRMALAKDLLRREGGGVAEVAQSVGYSSASTFSVAFARHVGLPPMRYAREQRDA
ncbi:AraC family transcriptional regulator [Lichenicola cladoniae]|uniref:AraC family transcriptional regulator n=1 Tax=Lichenicola cladoniae TaxID=1484109 RepID=A0A6M8HVW7_9PROT|nr:AraC family transcriptional regulator [Lichenicola cladoniae]NPD70329.1 AraC family transcriptional regulator [Acetobacteraceae bacterium]QKE92271.1 AraC family transcriptional regulator [Lichenicola cladoniae]